VDRDPTRERNDQILVRKGRTPEHSDRTLADRDPIRERNDRTLVRKGRIPVHSGQARELNDLAEADLPKASSMIFSTWAAHRQEVVPGSVPALVPLPVAEQRVTSCRIALKQASVPTAPVPTTDRAQENDPALENDLVLVKDPALVKDLVLAKDLVLERDRSPAIALDPVAVSWQKIDQTGLSTHSRGRAIVRSDTLKCRIR